MKRRIAVRGVFVHEGKLLCVKLKPYNGQRTDFWCTIGGGVDDTEPFLGAIQREIIEETGITPEVGNLLYVQQYVQDDVENTEFFFHIKNAEDFVNIDLSKSTHGQEEIAEIAFMDPKSGHVLPKFLQFKDFTNFDPNAAVEFYSYL